MLWRKILYARTHTRTHTYTHSISSVEESMKDCLLQELKTMIGMTETTTIHSVYFGGGTPSLASPDTIEAIIEGLSLLCHMPSGTEVTLEANPSEWQKFR
jgi:coproporphyrinogen III oxidase-like Fe-S oxidoreductase